MLRGRMTVKTLLILLALLPLLSLKAQENNYPTLEAIKTLEIPAWDFADTIMRFGWGSATEAPAPSPPILQVGDRDSFFVSDADRSYSEPVKAELRGMTDNVLIWVQESAAFWRQRSQLTAEWVEANVIERFGQLLGYQQPPGIDGDPRLTILMLSEPGFWLGGYFDTGSLAPKALFPYSNEREMVVVNLVYNDGASISDSVIRSIIAHEYQHMLLHFRDQSEEAWVDEGLAVFSEYLVSELGAVTSHAESFFQAPNTSLTTMYQSPEFYADYGAAGLFMIYIAERFGEEIIARLHAENLDGWRGVQKALRDHADVSADEVFADWALANYFLDAGRGFGYLALDSALESPQPTATLRSFPAMHSGSLPQYSAEYIEINARGAAALSLQLTQAPEARLIDSAPAEGGHIYYGATSDISNSRLTREFDLRNVSQAWLEFKVWYNLAEREEYAHVTISRDNGKSWDFLRGRHMSSTGQDGEAMRANYTGSSGGWLDERIRLTGYSRRRILLRFEMMTRANTTYQGMAIDDLSIEAIDFYDGFESVDSEWIEEGWIRTDNRLPNNTWLQVVQETEAGLEVTRSLIAGPGDLTVDLLPGVDRVLVAVSPVVLQTALETEYALAVNLLDADGNEIVVEFSCQLTTTAGLNFRDAPSGNKIGLVPQGTALWALDRSGDWFHVEYENERGWIHGGYVTRAGNCP